AREAPEQVQEAQKVVDALRSNLRTLLRHEESIKAMVTEEVAQGKKLGLDTVALANLRDELNNADQSCKRIAEELEVLKIERLAPERVEVINKARVPQTRDEMRQAKAGGAAAAVAFLAVLAGVSLWEFRTRRIH